MTTKPMALRRREAAQFLTDPAADEDFAARMRSTPDRADRGDNWKPIGEIAAAVLQRLAKEGR